MYYKNIYIRDFGIFNNQNIDNISKNIVVIGGKNRAGKSTFFQIMKYLPYGLPQDNSIPPAKNRYYIEADLKKKNKDYKFLVKGFAAPEIMDQEKNKYQTAELFNNLDQLSYQQLFTISLDELQLLSDIVKGKKQEKRLFSILLGAGLSKLIKVPAVADRYFNYANNIGGKLGDPSVAAFKPYYNEIKEAEKIRDQALLEIKNFNQKRNELEKKENSFAKTKRKITELENQHFLLDLLKNNYQLIAEIEKLEAKLNLSELDLDNFDYKKIDQIVALKEKFKNIKNELNRVKIKINNSINDNKIEEFLNYIKEYSNEIKKYNRKQELFLEKIKNYKTQKRKIKNDYQDLISELENLNSSWEYPLKELKNIELDLIKEENLSSNILKFEKLAAEIKDLENEKETLNYKTKEKKAELSKLKNKKPKKILINSYLLLFSALLILSSSFFLNNTKFSYLALIIAAAAFIYYSSNYNSAKISAAQKADLTKKIELNNKNINFIKDKLESKKNKLSALEDKLNNLASNLGNPNLAEYRFLESYFRKIKDKKRRFKKIKLTEEELSKRKKDITTELKNIYDIITKAAEFEIFNLNLENDFKIKDKELLINNPKKLFEKLKQTAAIDQLAEKYFAKENELEIFKEELKLFLADFKEDLSLEKRLNLLYNRENERAEKKKTAKEFQTKKTQLKHILKSSDKVKNILSETETKNSYFAIFFDLYKDYSSLEAVEKKERAFAEKLQKAETNKVELEKEITTLKNTVEQLATSTKIKKAQHKINKAQSNLELKAERYAVNRTVSFILNKLRRNMVAKAEKKLLKPASEILAKITNGHYNDIKTAADLDRSDFKINTAAGSEIQSSEKLSRGSLEQLFLAVRISRIKEIKPKLPVILDDSLVNFDQKHLFQTAKIIANLAANRQIFVLSCHPDLISYLSRFSDSIQYWKLDNGNFNLSNKKDLINYLNI